MQERFPLKGTKGNKKGKNSPFIRPFVEFSFGKILKF